ncbi:MAG: DUF5810 domain-containing protein [Halodesulfurarchaeum sp.]
MGYACPICDEPQVDEEHLANHVAFTAILRGEEHEEWLSEHVPDWGERSPETLAPLVAERADEVDLDIPEEVIEQSSPAVPDRGVQGNDFGDLSQSDREILEEARDLTRRMAADSRDDPDEEE